MKLFFILALATCLSGCFPLGCFIPGSPVDEVPVQDEPKVVYGYVPPAPDRFSFGPADQFRLGQWGGYEISIGGQPASKIKIAVVGTQDHGFWIETTIVNSSENYIRSQGVDQDGKVQKSYYAEPGKPAELQRIEPMPEPPSPEWPKFQKEDVGPDEVRIGSAVLKTDRVVKTFTDEDGRVVTETSWWSAEVPPLYAARQGKGLVRRVGWADEVRLVEYGTGARRQVAIPESK